jgi:hypothetical protein
MAGSTRWISLPLLAVCFTAACTDGSPSDATAAGLPASLDGYVWGHVVDESGVCIMGAVVQIQIGPGAGRSFRQDQPCDAWSYGDGFEFKSLPPGAQLKLRATADGWKSQDVDIVVGNGGPPVTFALERE